MIDSWSLSSALLFSPPWSMRLKAWWLIRPHATSHLLSLDFRTGSSISTMRQLRMSEALHSLLIQVEISKPRFKSSVFSPWQYDMLLRARFDLICSRHMIWLNKNIISSISCVSKPFDCQMIWLKSKTTNWEVDILKTVRCLKITTFQLDACGNVAHYVGSWATGNQNEWQGFSKQVRYGTNQGRPFYQTQKRNLKGTGWGYHQGGDWIEKRGDFGWMIFKGTFWNEVVLMNDVLHHSNVLHCCLLFRRWDASDMVTKEWIGSYLKWNWTPRMTSGSFVIWSLPFDRHCLRIDVRTPPWEQNF